MHNSARLRIQNTRWFVGYGAINFGIMYGKGAFSLGKDLGISVKEADTFLKTYLNTFPKVDGYMQNCIEHAKEKGYVETLFGRRRPLPELASSNFQVRSSWVTSDSGMW